MTKKISSLHLNLAAWCVKLSFSKLCIRHDVSDVKTDENTWTSQPSYLHLTARFTTKYPSEIVLLENSENGSNLSTKLYNCLLLRREFCLIPQRFYFETIIRLSLGFLMVGAFKKNATGEWGMRLRPVADETILNKQPRGFQGATDSLKKKSLLRAYKLWNQSAPSVHKPTERNTTNVYTRHEDFYAKPITTISA